MPRKSSHVHPSEMSDHDLLLWWQALQHVTPLPEVEAFTLPETEEEPETAESAKVEKTTVRHVPAVSRQRVPATKAPALPSPPRVLERGNYAGIDRNTARRFQRGKMPPARTLDLHGMNRLQAHAALERVLSAAYAEGVRVVCVITGRGRGASLSHEPPRPGILQQALDEWLRDPPFTRWVLAFDRAPQHAGGTGASYVLIKRRKSSSAQGNAQDKLPRGSHDA